MGTCGAVCCADPLGPAGCTDGYRRAALCWLVAGWVAAMAAVQFFTSFVDERQHHVGPCIHQLVARAVDGMCLLLAVCLMAGEVQAVARMEGARIVSCLVSLGHVIQI
ncbi:hypothetical protein COO60DRAFT_1494901 [Scenedesmus sp. NREL 46B-D3]|nr:hypothetical protein COO60DRAFT_1494901 [Scenedesmus sp. NREL 46B-D3]